MNYHFIYLGSLLLAYCVIPFLESKMNPAIMRLKVLQRILTRHPCASKFARPLTSNPHPDPFTPIDEPLTLSMKGLNPDSKVALEISVKNPEEKLDFSSKTIYSTTRSGLFDTGECPALGGSYAGDDPMGPFIHMKPQSDDCTTTIQVTDTSKMVRFDVKLSNGETGEQLGEMTLKRSYYDPDKVERIPITKDDPGRVRGVLFLPKNSKQGQFQMTEVIILTLNRLTVDAK